ncbi:hypothetical protein D3C75_1114770 [compost metagenome]
MKAGRVFAQFAGVGSELLGMKIEIVEVICIEMQVQKLGYTFMLPCPADKFPCPPDAVIGGHQQRRCTETQRGITCLH